MWKAVSTIWESTFKGNACLFPPWATTPWKYSTCAQVNG